MKIAISSTSKDIKGEIADIFGRCPFFAIIDVDLEEKKINETNFIENISADQPGGAGVSASQLVVDNKAEAVISGNIGPRAKEVLQKFQVDMYIAQGSLEQAVKDMWEDKLKKVV